MHHRLILLLSLLLLLAAGCTGSDGELKGPAEDGSVEHNQGRSLPSLLPAGSDNSVPAEATIASLVANPGAFEDHLLHVEGLFLSSPGRVCPDKRFGAPVSWSLAAGSETIAVAGLDALAAALPDSQITLLVEGTWRSWPIPAACRQEGDPGELYYLEAVQVISPNPIALAPGDALPGNDLLVTPSAGPDGQLPPTAAVQSIIPTATTIPGIEQPAPATTDGSAYPPPGITPSTGSGSYPGPQATATVNPGPYPGPAASPTPVPEQLATVPAESAALDRADLTAGALESGSLAPGQSERWTYTITATQTIDLQIMPDTELELIATIMDREGEVITTGPTPRPGQPLILPAVNLPEAGEYTILLTTFQGGAGNYAILLSEQDGYNFTFKENLADSISFSDELLPENDHFYFFSGLAGDVIDLTVLPLDGADLFLRLFDPSASLLITMQNDSPAGQEEQISAYTLPESGLYSLLIGEMAFAGGTYELILKGL